MAIRVWFQPDPGRLNGVKDPRGRPADSLQNPCKVRGGSSGSIMRSAVRRFAFAVICLPVLPFSAVSASAARYTDRIGQRHVIDSGSVDLYRRSCEDIASRDHRLRPHTAPTSPISRRVNCAIDDERNSSYIQGVTVTMPNSFVFGWLNAAPLLRRAT